MRFSKYAFLAFALSFVAALFPQPVRAAPETIFIDDFTDTSKVDLEQTTAHVNTVQGWVELAQPPKSGVISVDPSADPAWPSNVIVADETGVGWYAFDQSIRTMHRVDALSAPYQNALAVSLVPETKNFWVLVRGDGNDDYILKQAVFDGAGMVDNPLVAVSGLTQVVAIAAVDSASVAVADENGRVTVYSEGRVDTAHSFDTGLQGIRSVINIPGTWNFIVVTGDGAHLFVYDQGTFRYVESVAHRIQAGGQEILAGAQAEGGALVDLITLDRNLGYVYDQSAGRYVEAGVYAIGDLKSPLAVALPSTQVVAVAEEEGRVRFFRYAGGSFAADPGLTITGLSWTKDYRSPGVYVSKPIDPGAPKNMFRLAVDEQNDPGTSVRYELSVDGGQTYTPIIPQIGDTSVDFVHLPVGTYNPPEGANVPPGPYIIRATLESPSRDATPRITYVELQACLDVTPPTAPGKPDGDPNPSGQTTTRIVWAPAEDVIASPSTCASGIETYQIRFSTDRGKTWTNWINTGSNTPGYDLTVPENTSAEYWIQVRAIDRAGNIGPESETGIVYINTKPLGVSNIGVTYMLYPSPDKYPIQEGQVGYYANPPITDLPVYVYAGGSVTYEVVSTGGAERVHVVYSDGTEQDLVLKDPVTDPALPPTAKDVSRWEGWYYPSSDRVIPFSYDIGTHIWIEKIIVEGLGKPPYETSSDLLIIDGSISRGSRDPALSPRLVE